MEAYILDRCQGHPHIEQMLDVFCDVAEPQHHYLVFERGTCDLTVVLRRPDPMQPMIVRGALGNLISALTHVHGLGLIHADLKPDNILAFEGASTSPGHPQPRSSPNRNLV
jgi:serine/threonine protein kinase